MYGIRLKQHDIEIRETYFRTDPTTVLQWLFGADMKQPQIVANRVAEILENSTIDHWTNFKSCGHQHQTNNYSWAENKWMPRRAGTASWKWGVCAINSLNLFQLKTDDSEQVSGVVPEEKDMEREEFCSFRKMIRFSACCLQNHILGVHRYNFSALLLKKSKTRFLVGLLGRKNSAGLLNLHLRLRINVLRSNTFFPTELDFFIIFGF